MIKFLNALSRALFCLALVLLLAGKSFAGVSAYSGTAGEKLFIEEASKLGKKVFLIKFDGVSSKWAGKVIKTEQRTTANGDRYGFEYELELSSGIQKKTYEIVADDGENFIDGSSVKKIELYYPEAGNKEVNLNYDSALTKASQKINLIGQYKKSPYKPEVD